MNARGRFGRVRARRTKELSSALRPALRAYLWTLAHDAGLTDGDRIMCGLRKHMTPVVSCDLSHLIPATDERGTVVIWQDGEQWLNVTLGCSTCNNELGDDYADPVWCEASLNLTRASFLPFDRTARIELPDSPPVPRGNAKDSILDIARRCMERI